MVKFVLRASAYILQISLNKAGSEIMLNTARLTANAYDVHF